VKNPLEARILVVDDRPEQLVTLRATLTDLADDVVCAASGREALRRLLDPDEFALILLDIHMPTMDGFELAELIRGHRVHRNTPIIFLTASGDEMQEQRCYSLGAVDYILTPIVPTVLRTKVRVLVELHRKSLQIRRQAEALRRRATQLHALAHASATIHSCGSIDEIVRAAATAAREITGANLSVAIAAPAGDVVPPHVAEVTGAEAGERVAGKGTEALAALASLVRKRGSSVRMSERELAESAEWTEGRANHELRGYLAAPLRWPDGQYLGVLQLAGKRGDFDADDEAVVVQLAQLGSIAIQNRTLSDAREANRLKDEFLGNLSHELRNPLNALAGWTSMLRKGTLEPSSQQQAVATIERNVSALGKLVDDLLDVSRIASNRLLLSTRSMLLEDTIRESVENLRPAAAAKGIELECTLESPLEVMGDAHRLGQVAWNLLSNALKFTPAGGHVGVTLSRSANEAVLTVRDDGEGMSADFVPYVFDRFRQARPTTRRGVGGLGLGLAIVRSIVELHGGTVQAQSEGPGKGARFEARLPLLPPAPRLDGYHVLVIERDGESRLALERAFVTCGATVTAVASAEEADNAVGAREPPHVVVAPGNSAGAEAMRRLRELATPMQLPALGVTDGELDERTETVLSASFQIHASKRAGAGALAQAIRRIVPRPGVRGGTASRATSTLPD
jgi:signal transduction histidine kinase